MADEEWERRLQELMKLIEEGGKKGYTGNVSVMCKRGLSVMPVSAGNGAKRVGLHCGSGSA